MTIQLVLRSPDETADEGFLLSFPSEEFYWQSLLSSEPHPDITKLAFKMYPSGSIIDSFADTETEEAYESYIRILH